MSTPDPLTNNNAERAAGFYRLMRILIIVATIAVVVLIFK